MFKTLVVATAAAIYIGMAATPADARCNVIVVPQPGHQVYNQYPCTRRGYGGGGYEIYGEWNSHRVVTDHQWGEFRARCIGYDCPAGIPFAIPGGGYGYAPGIRRY